MEIGIYTFADIAPDPKTGKTISAHQRLRNLMEEAELADQVGLDVFAVGEHHRPDYAVSAPAVVLGAAAERTKNIKLSSAVTVISSDDPVRVFQDYATLDLLSGGRAEIMAGRGSFIESFPLFGYDLDDYDELFSEKLELLLEARASEIVYWPGSTHTQRIENRGVYPRPIQDPLPVWIAVGGTPQSVARAGILGLPLALAIIGGQPVRFAPLIELYRRAATDVVNAGESLPVSINSHAFVADTSQKAADVFYPGYAEVMSRIGRERGWPATWRAPARGQPAGGDREDPRAVRDLPARSLPRAAQRRPDAAQRAVARDRAAGDGGGAGGPKARGVAATARVRPGPRW